MANRDNIEIERKWLVKSLSEDDIAAMSVRRADMEQAYISYSPVIRVRRADDDFELTFKSRGHIYRAEYNMTIDAEQYAGLLAKAERGLVRKTRYYIPIEAVDTLTAEVDVFRGSIAPLITAEVEFSSLEEAQGFEPPDWFGEDVSERGEYSNAALARGLAE